MQAAAVMTTTTTTNADDADDGSGKEEGTTTITDLTTTMSDCCSVTMITDDEFKTLMNIRTITCFVNLTRNCLEQEQGEDEQDNNNMSSAPQKPPPRLLLLDEIIANAARFLKSAEQVFTVSGGYTVQTLRIATNPFGEWLETRNLALAKQQLQRLDSLLELHDIEFCALGPALTEQQVMEICPLIVATTSSSSQYRLSCSAQLRAMDVSMARACAACIKTISLNGNGDGLGNFRFAVTANCHDKTNIPFFPAASAKSSTNNGGINDVDSSSENNSRIAFAIGLENGVLANRLLAQCGSIENIHTIFKSNMHRALVPIQAIANMIVEQQSQQVTFLGIDTSLNPSLHAHGSIARAVEQLQEVHVFGGPGTLAAAAAITTCLQSLPNDIQCTGYCGLMLPVCEDQRLVQLASNSSNNSKESIDKGEGTTTTATAAGGERTLTIADILSICSVCGVGIDTVPIAGNVSEQVLASLLLDVAGIAERWNKSLSCRVLPMPGKNIGSMTTFESPYMINTKVMSLL